MAIDESEAETTAVAAAPRRGKDLAAEREALLIPAHFGGSHMARVLRDGTGFRPVVAPFG